MDEVPDDSRLTFTMSINEGVVKSEFAAKEEPSNILLAVLMRPLVTAESPIACGRVWRLLKDAVDMNAEIAANIDDALVRAEAGQIPVEFNGRRITQQEIYEVLASGEFFTEKAEEARTLRALRFGPMADFIWMHFYSYCVDMYGIAEAILTATPPFASRDEAVVPDPRCIYCLQDAGAFTSEEHVIPEAFGNDDAVLPVGYVCDVCNNNVLAELDEYLANFEAISLQRVINVPYTKKGKLPRAEFGNAIVEKRMPRLLRIIDRNQGDPFQIYDTQPDGFCRFNLHLRSRKPFESKMLGRALCKIGLGMIAFHVGRDRACSSRYSVTRSFIRGEGVLDNNLILLTKTGEPHTQVAFTWFDQEGGTPCVADFYGVLMFFNLEEEPKLVLDPNDPLAQDFTSFNLGASVPTST